MASTTVAQFATELQGSGRSCCSSSCARPVSSRRPNTDALSDDDKARLLDSLRKAHGGRGGREEEDHADAQADDRDQAGRCLGQGAHDPGRGPQEARVRQARRERLRKRRAPAPRPRRRCIDEAELAKREEEARRQAEFIARQMQEAREKAERAQRELAAVQLEQENRGHRRLRARGRPKRPPSWRRVELAQNDADRAAQRGGRSAAACPPCGRRRSRRHQEHDGGTEEGGRRLGRAGTAGHAAQADGQDRRQAGRGEEGREEAGRQGNQVRQARLELVRRAAEEAHAQDARRYDRRYRSHGAARKGIASTAGDECRRRSAVSLPAEPISARRRRCRRRSRSPISRTRCRSRLPRSSRS